MNRKIRPLFVVAALQKFFFFLFIFIIFDNRINHGDLWLMLPFKLFVSYLFKRWNNLKEATSPLKYCTGVMLCNVTLIKIIPYSSYVSISERLVSPCGEVNKLFFWYWLMSLKKCQLETGNSFFLLQIVIWLKGCSHWSHPEMKYCRDLMPWLFFCFCQFSALTDTFIRLHTAAFWATEDLRTTWFYHSDPVFVNTCHLLVIQPNVTQKGGEIKTSKWNTHALPRTHTFSPLAVTDLEHNLLINRAQQPIRLWEW